MGNKRYGLKEVANVVFFDISTGDVALMLDTLKVAGIENESESAEARGGQGNGRLISWDYGRTATLTLQDALLSDATLAVLSGNAKKDGPATVHARETHTVNAGKVTVDNTPKGDVKVYANVNGALGEKLSATATASAVTITGAEDGDQVTVFYTYESDAETALISFTSNAFPATYKVVGDTVVRGEDGKDYRAQFVIPKAKLQTGFSLQMDAENVSTFDLTLDVMVENTTTNRLYDVIRLG